MKRLWIAGMIVSLIITLLAGCGNVTTPKPTSSDTVSGYPVIVNNVPLGQPPERIVVLSPAVATLLKEMGLTEAIVGCVTEGKPEEFSRATQIGSALDPDWEVIASLAPDLVLAQDLSKTAATWLTENGISFLTFAYAHSLNALETQYHNIATALQGNINGPETADACFRRVKTALKMISDTVGIPDVSYTAIYVADLYGHVATGDTLMNDIFSASGVINAAAYGTDWQLPENHGDIQLIFCPDSIYDALIASERYVNTPAVRNGCVYPLDNELFFCQGEQLASLAEAMARAAYPSRFLSDNTGTTVSSSETDIRTTAS